MLGVTFVLLLSVFLFSKGEINGAHRWIYLGGLSFQPSELAKLAFLIYLSAWLAERKEEMHSFKTFGVFVGILAAIGLLVLKQPDLGTFSIILVSSLLVYVVAGITWTQMVAGLAALTVAVLGFIATPYRRARITTFLDPTNDTSGISYHVKNIAIAVGSGGLFGLGFGASGQKRLFLPEPHTDSIFAVITEELGFFIAGLLIVAIGFLIYRGYRVAMNCEDRFGKLLAVGITSWFAFQAFINLASMLHLVPLVGVPLPFISYGGTNLIISLTAVGVLLNISRDVTIPSPTTKQSKEITKRKKHS
jgi:cell division protein FtsW